MTTSLPSDPTSYYSPHLHSSTHTGFSLCSSHFRVIAFTVPSAVMISQTTAWLVYSVSSDLYSNATSVSLSLVTITKITNPNTSYPTSLRPSPQKVKSDNELTFCSSLLTRWIWSLLVCWFSSETKDDGKMKSLHLTHRGSNSSKEGGKLMDLLSLNLSNL